MGSERKSALRPVLEEAACRGEEVFRLYLKTSLPSFIVLSIAESSLYLDDPSVREEVRTASTLLTPVTFSTIP